MLIHAPRAAEIDDVFCSVLIIIGGYGFVARGEEVRHLRRADLRLVPLVARFAPRFLSDIHVADLSNRMQCLNELPAIEISLACPTSPSKDCVNHIEFWQIRQLMLLYR